MFDQTMKPFLNNKTCKYTIANTPILKCCHIFTGTTKHFVHGVYNYSLVAKEDGASCSHLIKAD